ncbi:hypothetical protein [Clostridioides difficile]|uniref:hypothetical protein n=1 Tax=Clostridioides difficile TaxID=1496 RepID=UPI003F8D64B4
MGICRWNVSSNVKCAKNSFVVSAFVMNLVYYFMLLVGVILFVFMGEGHLKLQMK